MRYSFAFLAFFIFSGPVFCQSTATGKIAQGNSSFFAEGGGPGIMFSANYDKRFTAIRLGWGARIGVGFVTAWDDFDNFDWELSSAITLPIQVNYIFGKANSPHTLEAGAGITYVSKELEILNFYDDRRTQLFGTFCFMYRRQPADGGFSWRAGFTPLIGNGLIQPLGALSVGYNF